MGIKYRWRSNGSKKHMEAKGNWWDAEHDE